MSVKDGSNSRQPQQQGGYSSARNKGLYGRQHGSAVVLLLSGSPQKVPPDLDLNSFVMLILPGNAFTDLLRGMSFI